MLSWLRSVFKPLRSADPFASPFGDLPNIPLPSGSILDVPAEQSLKFGAGRSSRVVDLIKLSDRRAAPAEKGSGGDGKTSRVPSLPVIQGRGRRAF